MNQKELEEEQRLIAVNQIRKSELKPSKRCTHKVQPFDGKWFRNTLLRLLSFLKTKSKQQSKVDQPVVTLFRQYL